VYDPLFAEKSEGSEAQCKGEASDLFASDPEVRPRVEPVYLRRLLQRWPDAVGIPFSLPQVASMPAVTRSRRRLREETISASPRQAVLVTSGSTEATRDAMDRVACALHLADRRATGHSWQAVTNLGKRPTLARKLGAPTSNDSKVFVWHPCATA
jgi:hypothetical protein